MAIKMQPKKYEEQKEFNKRCMNNAKLGSDYPNRDDRFKVCLMLWKKNFDPKQQLLTIFCLHLLKY